MNRDLKKDNFSTIGNVLKDFRIEKDKYVSREFQQYGYDLAVELKDIKHKSLYIKLAKETPRGLLESARTYVKDAYTADSKGRLFMWKLKQLKDKAKEKQK